MVGPGDVSPSPALTGHKESDVAERTCDVEGCDRGHNAHGLCDTHYARLRLRGNVRPDIPIVVTKTDVPLLGNRDTGCWLWPGYRSPAGYGVVRWKGKTTRTHRFVYEAIYGPIPEGMFVCHRCDNPPCCNPDHLFLGTHTDNMRDMYAKGRAVPTRGEACPSARLTEADVQAIRIAHLAKVPQRTLARRFQVSTPTINHIVRGRTWRHVPHPEPEDVPTLALEAV